MLVASHVLFEQPSYTTNGSQMQKKSLVSSFETKLLNVKEKKSTQNEVFRTIENLQKLPHHSYGSHFIWRRRMFDQIFKTGRKNIEKGRKK